VNHFLTMFCPPVIYRLTIRGYCLNTPDYALLLPSGRFPNLVEPRSELRTGADPA
jgi:hypothetical protein